MFNTKRLDGENEEQYIWRLGEAKTSGAADLDWSEIRDLINHEFRNDESEYRDESAYRKSYQHAKRFFDAGVFTDTSVDDYLDSIEERRRELEMAKQSLRDERTDYQRSIREEARRNSFIELMRRVIAQEVKPLEFKSAERVRAKAVGDNDLVVCLSDLHAGLKTDNGWNRFDSDELRARLMSYAKTIREIAEDQGAGMCYVALGGDNISGAIHPNLRLENNENVVAQVKEVSMFISDFVDEISNYFSNTYVFSVSGNHSRLFPNKEEHVTGEELDDLVPFIMRLRLSNNKSVVVYDEKDGPHFVDETIKVIHTRFGHTFYLVHGDKDTPNNVLKNLTMMTGKKPDGIIMSHRHHNAYDSQYGTKIIQNGSVIGTDRYCVDHRIAGRPEQIVVVTSRNQAVKCLYDVQL